MTDLLLEAGQPGFTPIESLPGEFVVAPRAGMYRHRPRSAFRRSESRVYSVVHTWCGQSLYDPIVTDETDHLPECGSCYGRWASIDVDDLAFKPALGLRDLLPRPHSRWCRGLVAGSPADGRYGVCVLCNREVRWWGNGWQRHEPREALAQVWCPTCGWEHLCLHEDRDRQVIYCSRFGCDFSVLIRWETDDA